MRILYGVHGYGRGHAVRSLAVLSELRLRHEVLVLAHTRRRERECRES
jgi:UDP:flavonoid glycosyltransferase YjiC (YdhE family)